MTPEELYLDLLKKVLTDTIYGEEPDPDDAKVNRFIMGFIKHYIRGRAHTMVPVKRLDNLEYCMEQVRREGVAGDFAETGVWRGGSSIFMRAFLKVHGITDRRVFVADSFEGLPEPDAERFPEEARAHDSKIMVEEYGHFAVSLEEVQANFDTYGLLDDQVVFLKGWFKDTLPSAPIERLAVLRLDGDYYDSTMDALSALYPKLAVGGYVIIDDYGEDQWTYCRQAVNDYRERHGIHEEPQRVDSKCWFWKRSA